MEREARSADGFIPVPERPSAKSMEFVGAKTSGERRRILWLGVHIAKAILLRMAAAEETPLSPANQLHRKRPLFRLPIRQPAIATLLALLTAILQVKMTQQA